MNCSIGMFQWKEGQTSCLPCNDSYVTNEAGSVNEFQCVPHGEFYNPKLKCSPRGPLQIFLVRGRAIGKDFDFPDIGIKNGIDVHNFCAGVGIDIQDVGLKSKVGNTLSEYSYMVRYTFPKILCQERVYFWASMVRPRPK